MNGTVKCKSCGAMLSESALRMMGTDLCPRCFRPYAGVATPAAAVQAAEPKKKTPVCDICIAPGEGTKTSASKIRQVVALGFNPYADCGAPLNPSARSMGMSATDQYNGWKQQVERDTTDWNICAKCLVVIDRYLQPKSADTNSKTAMFENLLKTRGVPCQQCRKTVPVNPSLIPEAARKMAAGEICQFECPECRGTIVMSPEAKEAEKKPEAREAEKKREEKAERPELSSKPSNKKWWQFWK